MTVIEIQILDMQKEELGIEQNPIYLPFRFKDSAFIGYWIRHEELITFYVGSDTFICRASENNIKKFERLLNDKENK